MPTQGKPFFGQVLHWRQDYSRHFAATVCWACSCPCSCTSTVFVCEWKWLTARKWVWDDWCCLNFSTPFFQLEKPRETNAGSAHFAHGSVTTYSQARTLWHNRNRAHLAELESSAAIDNLQTILPENAEFVSTTFGLEYVLMVAEVKRTGHCWNIVSVVITGNDAMNGRTFNW